jgi:hypothetical protein
VRKVLSQLALRGKNAEAFLNVPGLLTNMKRAALDIHSAAPVILRYSDLFSDPFLCIANNFYFFPSKK